jgi:hypothetical protein
MKNHGKYINVRFRLIRTWSSVSLTYSALSTSLPATSRHVSMRIFNLFMISLRKFRLRAFVTDINNQLAWKHFDKALNMEKHVSVLVKSCFSQIRTIGSIRPYLSESACKTLVASGYISYRLWKRYSLWYQQQCAFETSNGDKYRRSVLGRLKFRKHTVVDTIKNSVSIVYTRCNQMKTYHSEIMSAWNETRNYYSVN